MKKFPLRPSSALFLIIGLCLFLLAFMQIQTALALQKQGVAEQEMQAVVQRLGLSDICVTNDARYLRHLVLSDPIAPVMDHPGAVEHFPGGSFWLPVQ